MAVFSDCSLLCCSAERTGLDAHKAIETKDKDSNPKINDGACSGMSTAS